MHHRRQHLTNELRDQIVAGIRSGGFPHVAAEAWGVPRAAFADWLRRGSGARAAEPYRSFATAIRSAQAQARLRAELEVFKDDPKIWLERGPGREGPDNPGWTSAVRPAETAAEAANPFTDPAFLTLTNLVLDGMSDQPELRARIARNVHEKSFPRAA